MKKTSKTLNLLILFLYILIRFFLTSWLDSLGTYSSYFFEIITLILFSAVNYKSAFSKPNFKLQFLFISLIFLPLGFIVYFLLRPLNITLPIDISSTEILFFLLMVAPILEEFIFRFFIWKNLEFLKLSSAKILVITSLLFSYSHLHAIWFFDNSFYPFILYQSTYTLIVGLLLGLINKKTNSILYPIVSHFLFNFGFYLGFKFLAYI